MPADKHPVFRRAIIPWYESTSVYIVLVLFMLLVFIFAAGGIAVTGEYPAYRGYIWVPAILLALSAAIIVTTTVRLIKRFSKKSAK